MIVDPLFFRCAPRSSLAQACSAAEVGTKYHFESLSSGGLFQNSSSFSYSREVACLIALLVTLLLHSWLFDLVTKLSSTPSIKSSRVENRLKISFSTALNEEKKLPEGEMIEPGSKPNQLKKIVPEPGRQKLTEHSVSENLPTKKERSIKERPIVSKRLEPVVETLAQLVVAKQERQAKKVEKPLVAKKTKPNRESYTERQVTPVEETKTSLASLIRKPDTAKLKPKKVALPTFEGLPLLLKPQYRTPPAAPKYPRLAKRKKQQGVVILRARISSQGIVDEIRLHLSSGYKLLDESALKAIRKWEFIPAKQGNQSIGAWVQVPIRFTF